MNTFIVCVAVIIMACLVFGFIFGRPEEVYRPGMCLAFLFFAVVISAVILGITINTMDEKGTMVEDSHRYYIGAELYGVTKDNTYLFIDEDDNIWEWESDNKYTYDKVYLLSMDINDTYSVRSDDILLMVWQEGG